MRKEDLKTNVVYLYDGSCGADGATILFTVKENSSFEYAGCIILHWSGNDVNIPSDCKISEGHLKTVTVANKKGSEYYAECAKKNKDVKGYTWHDSFE